MDYTKVKQTSRELFEAREYCITHDTELILSGLSKEGKRVRLYILQEPKLNVDTIKYYYSIFYTEHIDIGIIVYHNQVTSSVKKLLSNIHDIQIQLFRFRELLFNITKHRLVPQHIEISIEGVKELESYPTIETTDPVSRFYGFKSGALIKIIRNDGSIYYRVVR